METNQQIQDKYNRIINIMLEKVGEPLAACQEVIQRICALLEIDPPTERVQDSEDAKSSLIFNTLSKAQTVAEALVYIDMSTYKLDDAAFKMAAVELGEGSLLGAQQLESLVDAIAVPEDMPGLEKLSIGTKYNQHNKTRGRDGKEYTGISPSRPEHEEYNSKVSYDDYTIEKHTGDYNRAYSLGEKSTKPAPMFNLTPPITTATASTATATGASSSRPAPPASSTTTPPKTAAPVAASTAAAGSSSGGHYVAKKIEIPKWTKGPPSTPEEIAEYKAFMIAKYEAEQLLNAEILKERRSKGL
ncbi:hypothetical protein QOT17_022499 [Balamuthia mandrillaris]